MQPTIKKDEPENENPFLKLIEVKDLSFNLSKSIFKPYRTETLNDLKDCVENILKVSINL
jgi:hypothetical protein